jgi:hypothetical protein
MSSRITASHSNKAPSPRHRSSPENEVNHMRIENIAVHDSQNEALAANLIAGFSTAG